MGERFLDPRKSGREVSSERMDWEMPLTTADVSVVHIVRVRETQQYDIEVATTGGSRQAARVARRRFLGMTIEEQARRSVGVTSRTFETDKGEFDEDEFSGEGDD